MKSPRKDCEQELKTQRAFGAPPTFDRVVGQYRSLTCPASLTRIDFAYSGCCNADRQHFVQPTSAQTSEIHVDPAVLAKYAGVYEVMTPRGKSTATISVQGEQLMADVNGFGSGRMIPQSATMFAFRGAVVEFVANENGGVTHLIVHAVEGAFKGPRIDRLKP